MRFTAGGFALAAVVGIFVANARGDGKFFVPEKVPPGVPYQRAFLIFHDDSETLILQSKYDLRQSAAIDSLGWVVPVPAIPEIASAEPSMAGHCFFIAALRTQPDPLHIRSLFLLPSLLLFLGGIVSLLLCLVQYPFLKKMRLSKAAWGRRARNRVMVTALAFLLTAITIPGLSLARGASDVEVVKAEKAGIYDVKVIRGDDAEAITEWLRENGFSFDEEDTKVFQGYVDRAWCFVTAKVEPGTDEKKIAAGGMVAPLILKFVSNKPVYPLALTATTKSETEVLIYTFSDGKLTCGERLRLRHARQIKDWKILNSLLAQAQIEGWSLFDDLPETLMMLCKFKGRLTAAQMRQDLTFAPALDNEPYRERKIVW